MAIVHNPRPHNQDEHAAIGSRPAAAAQTALAKALTGVKSAAGRGNASGSSINNPVTAAASSSSSAAAAEAAAAAAAAETSAKAAEAVFAEFYAKQMDLLQVRSKTC